MLKTNMANDTLEVELSHMSLGRETCGKRGHPMLYLSANHDADIRYKGEVVSFEVDNAWWVRNRKRLLSAKFKLVLEFDE